MINKPALLFPILAIALVTLSGCISYKMGPGAELPFRTLYVEPVRNQSFAPQVQGTLTNHISQYFIKNGRVKLVSDPKKADAALRVKLTEFIRNPSVVDSTDTGRARSFGLQLIAECSLVNLTDSSIYFENRSFNAYINTFTDSGLQPSEYQDMPVLARRLADRIGDAVVAAW